MSKSSNNQSTQLVLISEDLKRQREYVKDLEKSGFDFGLVFAHAFVRGMRDIGYKSTATAINELIDNAVQAEASAVHVTLGFKSENRSQKKPDQIAVIDNGHGMDPTMIRASVLWGGTHRYDNRDGFGRYGYGLPSASISIGQRFRVFSKVEGANWHEVTIDLDVIKDHFRDGSGHVVAPEPKATSIPDWVEEYIEEHFGELKQGTVVLIDKIDRLTFWTGQKLQEFFMQSFGVTYRNFLREVKLSVDGKAVEPIDPLFITPGFRFYDIDDDRAEALDPLHIEVKDRDNKQPVGSIKVRFSYMPPTFLRPPELKQKEKGGKQNARFHVRKDNVGIIVLRAGRQIDVVTSKCPWTTVQNNDRYWGVEVDFSPKLDEEFSITTSKQQVGLSQRIWDILEDNGVYNAIKEMRAHYERDAKAFKVQREKEGIKRASETAMEEAQKFITRKPADETLEEKKNSLQNLEREARERAEKAGLSVESVKRELEAEAIGRPFKRDLVEHPGAPFYRVAQVGGQRVLYLNKAHRFFMDLYAAPDATPHSRAALEVLLFVLGDCELRATQDHKLFYESERAEWSKYLHVALNRLAEWDNFDDEVASRNEAAEAEQAAAERRKGAAAENLVL